MTQVNTLLGLYTETSLHAGTGQSTGVVDLPIQREGHNGWPCVFGSAVKGALRASAEDSPDHSKDSITCVFGPDTNNASEHAGALAVGDARLLLLPVRSLTSHFKWVTSPEGLKRLQRDSQRLGINIAQFEVPSVDQGHALVPQGEGDLFLEEYRFTAKEAEMGQLVKVLAGLMGRQDAEQALQNQLVVVGDDMFSHLVQHATPVNAHVRLENDTKTVAPGALWYEETLPPDSLLYVPLSASASRNNDNKLSADSIITTVFDLFPEERPFLQLGGNESVGMGWCRVKIVKED